jgi:predicted Fe-S protein YdhL (DUF1289 family)
MSDIPLPSPCIGICLLDPATGLCRGCFRTIDEIGGWMSFDNVERHRVLDRLRRRRRESGDDRRRGNPRRGRAEAS